MDLNQVTVPALDLEASIDFYRILGLQLIVHAEGRYARFECPNGGATFSLHHSEAPPADNGPLIYFECQHLDQECVRLTAAGVVFDQEPADQRWGWREARLRDPAGNALCLYHAGPNRRFPEWRLP